MPPWHPDTSQVKPHSRSSTRLSDMHTPLSLFRGNWQRLRAWEAGREIDLLPRPWLLLSPRMWPHLCPALGISSGVGAQGLSAALRWGAMTCPGPVTASPERMRATIKNFSQSEECTAPPANFYKRGSNGYLRSVGWGTCPCTGGSRWGGGGASCPGEALLRGQVWQ